MKTLQRIRKVNGEVIDRDKLINWVNRMLDRLDNGEIILELKPVDITEAQRRYYFSQVNQMAKHLGNTSDELHDIFKRRFLPREMLEYGGFSINLLDSEQMSSYIDCCIRLSAEYGFVWGDPEEYKHKYNF